LFVVCCLFAEHENSDHNDTFIPYYTVDNDNGSVYYKRLLLLSFYCHILLNVYKKNICWFDSKRYLIGLFAMKSVIINNHFCAKILFYACAAIYASGDNRPSAESDKHLGCPCASVCLCVCLWVRFGPLYFPNDWR